MISTISFPTMFFAFFGRPNLRRNVGSVDIGAFMMASYGAYAAMSVALIAYGVSISAERASSKHLAWIAAYAVAFLALAVIAYRRDEGKAFG